MGTFGSRVAISIRGMLGVAGLVGIAGCATNAKAPAKSNANNAPPASAGQDSKLSDGSISGTSISGTSISGTSISGTSISGTSISGTSISGTSTSGTSTSGTSISGTSGGFQVCSDGTPVGNTEDASCPAGYVGNIVYLCTVNGFEEIEDNCAPAGPTAYQGSVPSIAGSWHSQAALGLPILVQQSGSYLTVTEGGAVTQGFFTSPSAVYIFGLVGTLEAGNVISWSNGSAWERGSAVVLPNIAGSWHSPSSPFLAITVQQSFGSLQITEGGSSFAGSFISVSTISAFGLVGTLNQAADTISWSNGATWQAGVATPPNLPNIAGSWHSPAAPGLAITVQQSGQNLTIIEGSSVVQGSFTSASTISAFGMVGTIDQGADTITWSNGAYWLQGSPTPPTVPNIAGAWHSPSAPGLGITVQQSGGNLTITEGSSVVQGLFTSATTISAFGLVGTLNANGDTITWSNGATWQIGPVTPPTLANVAGVWHAPSAPSLAISVQQSGAGLTITENSSVSQGTVTSASSISAFGLLGTLSAGGNTITWSNGATWNR